jgi:hypothetical protein
MLFALPGYQFPYRSTIAGSSKNNSKNNSKIKIKIKNEGKKTKIE